MYYQRLKELREEKNLTIQSISKLLEFEKDTYGKFEREYTLIPIKHLNLICNYFDVSLDYIFNFTDIKKYKVSKDTINNKVSGIRLKEFRVKNKLTQDKLASIINCSYGTIAGYESGRYIIATPFLYDICRKYKISADYLLGKIDEPKYIK